MLSVVLDSHEVIAGGLGGVGHLVPAVGFDAFQSYLGRTVDGHRQRAGASVGSVDSEAGFLAWKVRLKKNILKNVSMSSFLYPLFYWELYAVFFLYIRFKISD